MKTRVIFLVCALTSALAADDVRPGASLGEVQAVLGPPNGEAQINDRQLLYYERGTVELRDGRVTKVALRTVEEHAALIAREERMRTERENVRARVLAEGNALRERKLADAMFQAAPAAHQVAFWEDFARRYPGVSVAEPLSIARMRLNEQLDEKRRRAEELNRLDQLEERLAAAEREPVYYRVRSHAVHYGRYHHHKEFGLGPVTYTLYDAPLPAYTTPTTPLIDVTPAYPALPRLNPSPRSHPDHGKDHWRSDRHDRRGFQRDWRGADYGRQRLRDRM
jgi:PAS domain-containing protein